MDSHACVLCHLGATDSSDLTEANFYFRDSFNLGGPQNFSVLWNAMIHPLLNMTIKGAIWYQGENKLFVHKIYMGYTGVTKIIDDITILNL